MFALSVAFVALLAMLIVVWVDIPRVVELSTVAQEPTATPASAYWLATADRVGKIILWLLLLLWPLFWIDYFFSMRRGEGSFFKRATSRGGILRSFACVIPPLRIAAPTHAKAGQIWLPGIHWNYPGKELTRRLSRAFSKPMLVIAMLILPILLVEYGLHRIVEEQPWLRMVLHIATGFIWWAFTIEFIIMVSVADKKIAYIKKNWIDLAIILLPLISFLRSFRVLRIARLAKVQKLAKMGRVFRMRGLAMKVLRAMMLLGFVNRLLRITPEKRLAKLHLKREEVLDELALLDEEIVEVEKSLDPDSQGIEAL